MELQMIDLVVSLFFLSALVLVARFKKQLSEEGKESYRFISAGLVILALVELSQVYDKTGLFNTLPFVSEPLFYQLVFWIGVITGLTFLVSGISHWLPLSRTYRKYNRSRLKSLEFLKRVEQLVGVERRLPVILSQSLQYMVEHYSFLAGAVYIYSQKRKTLVFLSSSVSNRVAEADIKQIVFDEGYEQMLLKNSFSCNGLIFKKVPRTIPQPNLALPLVVGEKLSALFLLWQDDKVICDDEERMNLKIAADIIARKVELDKERLAKAFLAKQQAWLRSLGEAVDHKRACNENVSGIARWLLEMIPHDLFSLTIIYDNKNIQRFSIGEDRMLLAEKGLNLHSHNPLLKYTLESGQPLVFEDTRQKTIAPIDKMILNSNMRSLAVFPLGFKGTTVGTIAVASKQTSSFKSREIELIKGVVPLLSSLVIQDIHRYEVNLKERRIELLNSFLLDCGRSPNLLSLFEQTANLLSKELKTSVVRISTYDYSGAFLKSRALSSLRSIEKVTPADGDMVLSLMPYHTLVRDTGRLMLINQQDTDRKIPVAEAKQVASSDLKSALLIPVKVEKQVLAVISLAEMRSWDRYRYTEADILFASSIATALSLAVQVMIRGQTRVGSKLAKERLSNGPLQDHEVRSRIKSSLSGILGSVEMIKFRTPTSDEDLDKYLSIIDRSAKRINTFFANELTP